MNFTQHEEPSYPITRNSLNLSKTSNKEFYSKEGIRKRGEKDPGGDTCPTALRTTGYSETPR